MSRRMSEEEPPEPYAHKTDEIDKQLEQISRQQQLMAESIKTLDDGIRFTSQEMDHMLKCEPKGAKYW